MEADPATKNPMLKPAWVSGDFFLPDPPVIVNGVLFSLSNGENAEQRGDESRRLQNTRPAVLKALDARTGKELFNSGAAMSGWVHFSALAIAEGNIYAVDHDSNVYCFGAGGSTLMSRTAAPVTARPTRSKLLSLLVPASADQPTQAELIRSWAARGVITLLLGLVAAVFGVWAARRNPINS